MSRGSESEGESVELGRSGVKTVSRESEDDNCKPGSHIRMVSRRREGVSRGSGDGKFGE